MRELGTVILDINSHFQSRGENKNISYRDKVKHFGKIKSLLKTGF